MRNSIIEGLAWTELFRRVVVHVPLDSLQRVYMNYAIIVTLLRRIEKCSYNVIANAYDYAEVSSFDGPSALPL